MEENGLKKGREINRTQNKLLTLFLNIVISLNVNKTLVNIMAKIGNRVKVTTFFPFSSLIDLSKLYQLIFHKTKSTV